MDGVTGMDTAGDSLTTMEGRPIAGMIMVELDGGPRMPMTALETAAIAKAYLQKQGAAFS